MNTEQLIPPNAFDIEEYILSAILVDENVLNKISMFLKDYHFYKEVNSIIYRIILELKEKNNPIDIVIVTNELRNQKLLDEVGGAYYISSLACKYINSLNIVNYSIIVIQKYIYRNIIQNCTNLIKKSYDETSLTEIFDELAAFNESLEKDINNVFNNNDNNVKDTCNLIIDNINKKINGESTLDDILLTNTYYDNLCTLANNEIIFNMGSPGSGKTRLLINNVFNILENNKDAAILWYSMEDDQAKIIRCFLSSKILISDKNIKQGNLEVNKKEKIEKLSNIISNYNLKIIDKISSADDIKRNYNSFCKKNYDKKCFLVIDNFQKIRDTVDTKMNDNAKDEYVSSKIAEIRDNIKKENIWSCIMVNDHVNKSSFGRHQKETGYRLEAGDLKGSTRKFEITTQLISINRPSIHTDLYQEEIENIDIKINDKFYKRKNILDNLTIVETLKDRDYGKTGNLIHLLYNYNFLKFKLLNDLK